MYSAHYLHSHAINAETVDPKEILDSFEGKENKDNLIELDYKYKAQDSLEKQEFFFKEKGL